MSVSFKSLHILLIYFDKHLFFSSRFFCLGRSQALQILLDTLNFHLACNAQDRYFYCCFYAACAFFGDLGLSELTAQLRRWYRAVFFNKHDLEIRVHFLGGGSRVIRAPGKMLVGDFLRFVASRFGVPQSSLKMIFRGRIVKNHLVTLNAARLSSGCSVQIDLRLRAGTHNPMFKSIIKETINDLLCAIQKDFDDWVLSDKPVYDKNHPCAGKPVEWDEFSGPVKYFFEQKNIVPSQKYSQFYSNEPHTVAISYVWKATKLSTIAGFCVLFVFS